MKRTHRLAIAAVAITLCIGGATLAYYKSAAPAVEMVPIHTPTWPNQAALQWKIPNVSLAPNEGVALLLRCQQTSKKPKQSQTVGPIRISPTEATSKITTGLMVLTAGGTESYTATVQLLSLRDIAVPTTDPLRCLITLDGRGSTYLNGEDSILKGDRFSGWSNIDNPTWQNNELHLFSFFTYGDHEAFTYNVILLKKQTTP
jgi:hypothetical protein